MRTKDDNLLKEHVLFVNKIIDYIDDHLDKGLTLDNIAVHVSFSPYHLHRIFKKVTGSHRLVF